MEIQLQNFRCHREVSYSLPEQGLVLISGPYGVGKSSILNAISYAFYGELRHPYTHGENSCKVIISYREMKITRTSRPNRLLLEYKGVEYEDAPAQKMIERVLGMNYREFLASSYVIQRKNNSVLTMSPSEQLQFVEVLAFSKDQHLEYRQKFKQNVKDKRDNKIRCETKLSELEKRLEEAKTNAPDISKLPPVEDLGTLEELETVEKSLEKEFKKSKETLGKLQKDLQRIREVEKEKEEAKEEIQKIEIKITSLEELRSKLGSEISLEDIQEQEKQVKETETLFKQTKAYEEYTIDLSRIKKLETDHLSSIKAHIKELEATIPPRKELLKLKNERDELEERQKKLVEIESLKVQKSQAISKFKEVQKKAGLKLKSSKAVIRNLHDQKDDLLSGIKEAEISISEHNNRMIYKEIESLVYECPSCSTKVRVQGKLLKKDEEIEENSSETNHESLLEQENRKLKSLTDQLQNVELWLQDLEQVQPFLANKIPKLDQVDFSNVRDIERRLLEIENAQESLKDLRSKVKRKDFPQSIQDLRQELKVKKTTFPSRFKPSISLEKLEKKMAEYNETLEDTLRRQAERSSLNREINGFARDLKRLKKRAKGQRIRTKTSSRIEEEIQQHQCRISEIVEEMQTISTTKNYLQQYEKVNLVSELEKRVEKVQKVVSRAESKLKGAMGLQEAGKEAEVQAITQTISCINEHARIYLDKMFEETIHVSLENYRLTKSKTLKSQMNVRVEYKGQIYNSINELSGGERQMCELAFLLAVNDMLGSPIALLDECLNNLDGETHMNRLMDLQALVKDKLILVISHKGFSGIFDKEIRM